MVCQVTFEYYLGEYDWLTYDLEQALQDSTHSKLQQPSKLLLELCIGPGILEVHLVLQQHKLATVFYIIFVWQDMSDFMTFKRENLVNIVYIYKIEGIYWNVLKYSWNLAPDFMILPRNLYEHTY